MTVDEGSRSTGGTSNVELWLDNKKRKSKGERFPTYKRTGTALTFALEDRLCEMESGHACRLFPSGMAALASAILTCTCAHGHVVYLQPAFSTLERLRQTLLNRWHIDVTCVPHDLDAAVEACRPTTQAIVLENPSYLLTDVMDVRRLHDYCGNRGIAVVVDSTWSSGVLSHPLTHGARLSVLACSKYIGSPHNAMGGAIIASEAYAAALNDIHYSLGQTIVDDDALAITLGIDTLRARMRKHRENCDHVLSALRVCPGRYRIVHPSIYTGRELQTFSALFSAWNGVFVLQLDQEVTPDQIIRVLRSLRIFSFRQQWGAPESAVRYIKSGGSHMSGGNGESLLRFSVGLEAPALLTEDLLMALDAGGLR